MTGIFGDLFDFNGDGKLDCVEQAADFLAFERLINEDKDEADISFSDDFDEDSDEDF